MTSQGPTWENYYATMEQLNNSLNAMSFMHTTEINDCITRLLDMEKRVALLEEKLASMSSEEAPQ
ncbi:MAG: hypothetical protein A2W31_15235 [Planctomycetes bacterium RBG_16_64_10]|nr:MAG: hypothetical protein A2W31_15235 [Planctomycetes bacterium RBG_16_64_10]